MNNMSESNGTVHGVPHDLMTCMTLCAKGTPEMLTLTETSRAIDCDECIQIITNPDINPQQPPNHIHLWQAPQLVHLIVGWYGTDQFASVWSQISAWAEKGQHVGIYQNNDLGSYDVGKPRIFPYEGEEFGQRLPDTATEINWRYSLEGVYRTDDHKADLTLADVYRPADLDEIKRKEAEQAAEAESDEDDNCPWCGQEHADDDECYSDDDYDDDDMWDEMEYELSEGDSDLY